MTNSIRWDLPVLREAWVVWDADGTVPVCSTEVSARLHGGVYVRAAVMSDGSPVPGDLPVLESDYQQEIDSLKAEVTRLTSELAETERRWHAANNEAHRCWDEDVARLTAELAMLHDEHTISYLAGAADWKKRAEKAEDACKDARLVIVALQADLAAARAAVIAINEVLTKWATGAAFVVGTTVQKDHSEAIAAARGDTGSPHVALGELDGMGPNGPVLQDRVRDLVVPRPTPGAGLVEGENLGSADFHKQDLDSLFDEAAQAPSPVETTREYLATNGSSLAELTEIQPAAALENWRMTADVCQVDRSCKNCGRGMRHPDCEWIGQEIAKAVLDVCWRPKSDVCPMCHGTRKITDDSGDDWDYCPDCTGKKGAK